jgi:hypothetical protein
MTARRFPPLWYVRFWHKADIPVALGDVRYWG